MAEKREGDPKPAGPAPTPGRTSGRKAAATGETRSFDPRPRDLLGPAGDPAEGKR